MPIAGAGAIAVEDRLDGLAQPVARVGGVSAVAARGAEFVHGDDEPERGIDGIVFRRVAGIGEAVGQHALAHRARPGEQDLLGIVEPPDWRASARAWR